MYTGSALRVVRAGLVVGAIFAFVSLCSVRHALAQSIPPIDPLTAGTHFILAFPDTTTTAVDPRYPNPLEEQILLLIYSAVNNEVRVHGLKIDTVVQAKAGKFLTVVLQNGITSTDTAYVMNTGVKSRNVFTVDAQLPIILNCYVMTKFGGEMWTPLPVDRWGKEYYMAALPGEVVVDMTLAARGGYVRRNRMASADLMVIAAYDETQVTIYPTGSFLSAPLTVTLNAGEAYQVQSVVDTISSHIGLPQPDVGGTLIQANRPIGVISGNTRCQVLPEVTAAIGNSLKNQATEWLAPAEQFGTEFVYLPTWDTRRLIGVPSEKVAEKRGYELVRVYGASDKMAPVYSQLDSVHYDTTMLSSTRIRDYKIPAIKPRYFRSEKPVQATMHSAAVAKFMGTGNPVAGQGNYLTWGAYMVTLVPREQWSTFAPFYAPNYPFDAKHYVNVIADTTQLDKIYDENGAPFDFNMGNIPGTDLMWGTMQITTGETHYLEGRYGARFFAYAYGIREGMENYARSAVTTYQEVVALSYGYPIAPMRAILSAGDSLRIDSSSSGCSFRVKVTAVNAHPVGFRTATLDSAANAGLQLVNPSTASGLIGYASGEFMVVPEDPRSDASGQLVLSDRTGRTWRLPYRYVAERLESSAGDMLDFGNININEAKNDTLELTNPLDRPVTIRSLRLVMNNQAVEITATEPAGPALQPAAPITLKPGGRFVVYLRAVPRTKDRVYRDTVRVALSCFDMSVPLRVGGVAPCIEVGDLDFGRLVLNQQATLPLRICNQGGGTVTLNNPGGDSVITWLLENFEVPKDRLDSLRNVTLGPGQCVNVPVTFSSPTPGTFEIVARVWASTRDCRDTSVWRAVVVHPDGSGVTGRAALVSAITSIRPNPLSARTAIGFTLGTSGRTTVEVFDAMGRVVGTLLHGRLDAGAHAVTWDASALPAGAYYCRVSSGTWSEVRTIIVAR